MTEDEKKSTPSNAEASSVVEEVQTCKDEDNALQFLRKIQLECYYDSLVTHGGDKLEYLVYVDDTVLDQVCNLVNMKAIHSGVFKKAVREHRMNNSYLSNDKSRFSSCKSEMLNAAYSSSSSSYRNPFTMNEHNNEYMESRRRCLYNSDAPSSYIHTSSSHGQMLHVMPLTTPQGGNIATENAGYYSRISSGSALESYKARPRSAYNNEEAYPPSMALNNCLENGGRSCLHDNQSILNHKSGSFVDEFSHHTLLPDGSYYVTVCDRSVKFPSAVKLLTYLEEIDKERRDIVRKGSQIFGRDDTKRKTAELAPLEVFMNEIALEVCLRDFTYLISRQKLLALVRDIVKENQIQLSSHHTTTTTTTFMSSNNSIPCLALKENGKLKTIELKPKICMVNTESADNSTTTNSSETNTSTDYEVILFYKVHREWPSGISKERKKYLGRRSSSFDAVESVLYYIKDGKRRLWLPKEEDLRECFNKHHINSETGEHYSKEVTIERLMSSYYCKNMHERLSRLMMTCDVCRQKLILVNYQSPYGTRSSNKQGASIIDESENPQVYAFYHGEPLPEFVQAAEPPPQSLSLVSSKRKTNIQKFNINSQTKRARKSTPHKLVQLDMNSQDKPSSPDLIVKLPFASEDGFLDCAMDSNENVDNPLDENGFPEPNPENYTSEISPEVISPTQV